MGGRANFYIDNCGEFGGSSQEIETVKLTETGDAELKEKRRVLPRDLGRRLVLQQGDPHA
jgi:hypothetical protein